MKHVEFNYLITFSTQPTETACVGEERYGLLSEDDNGGLYVWEG
jgi:hypothetical protein